MRRSAHDGLLGASEARARPGRTRDAGDLVAALLVDDPTHARPIVSELLKGRVTIAPSGTAKKRWTVTGEGTLAGLFSKANRIL